MAQTFVLHADDIGLSPGITASIVRSIDEGSIRSVSLICNGVAVEEAVAALMARPAVRVSLHLNLLEGWPLSNPQDIPLLVDAEGRLAATFKRLVGLWLGGDARKRTAVCEQMKREFAAQISRGCAALAAAGRPVDALRIDSHTHIHALGFVLDAILACPGSQRISYVRVPREPWHIGRRAGDAKALLRDANIVKWGVLNHLSRGMIRKLDARGIAFNCAFLGVLHTGRMTVSAIEAGVEAVLGAWPKELPRDAEPVEILLHPGKADPSEADQWQGRPELWAYYRSEDRDREAQTARDVKSSPLLSAHFGGA